jgi:hypothetical protein
VDKVQGKDLSSNDYTTAEKIKLDAITGTNTGDQDLSGFATTADLNSKVNTSDMTTALATKVDKVQGKNLSSNDYTTAEKIKLDAITGTNTGDQDLSGFATTADLNSKVNTSDMTTALATKVDKVQGKNLSSNDYTTAEKIKLDAITGTNTGDQDLSGFATTAALSAKANTTDVTTSLAIKENIANKSAATDLGGNSTSNSLFPTQQAVKTYVDTEINAIRIQDGSIQNRHLAIGAVDLNTKVTGILSTTYGGTGIQTSSANKFFASPDGTSGAPSFRSLVSADLPSLTSSYIANTSTPQTANFNISGNGAIGGTLTTNQDIKVNNITLGLGTGNYAGRPNLVMGINSFIQNISGYGNIAIGHSTLPKNTTGYGNTGLGFFSMENNTEGNFNVALGTTILTMNSIGSYNIGIGSQNLFYNTEGNYNTAVGTGALTKNTTGSKNIALGYMSLYENLTGNENISLGNLSGYSITTGSNNMTLGYDAQPSVGTVSNEITLGNSSITVLRAKVNSITALSDRRDKTDIVIISEGIDFIKQLKPVTFTWNTRDQAKVGIKSVGFIAQDLLALQKSSLIGENLDLVSENNPEKLEARYNNLLPVLVKAIQDQQQVIEDQKIRVDALEKLVQQLIQAFGSAVVQESPALEKK